MSDTTPTPAESPTPPAPAYAAAPAGQKINVLAIVSLVTSILWLSIVGVITGHIALSQINKRGEGGKPLAIAGLIIGYLGALGWIIFWIVIGLSFASIATYSTYGY
jgi:hypothetical protein